MGKKRKSWTPTLIVFIVLFTGIYVVLSGFAAQVMMKFDGIELSTNSVGLALIFLAVMGVVVIVVKTNKKGQYDTPFFDPLPRSERSRRTIKCASCGADMPRSQLTCQNCGHKRPLY